MTQPTDRLGQPLSVGDWVEFNDHASPININNGVRVEISGFGDYGFVQNGEYAAFTNGRSALLVDLTKINPRPETTTWDKCAFVPEGINA